MDYLDNFCPFCRSFGTVKHYEKGTALYSDLKRCEACFQIFDEYEKNIQEDKSKKKKE